MGRRKKRRRKMQRRLTGRRQTRPGTAGVSPALPAPQQAGEDREGAAGRTAAVLARVTAAVAPAHGALSGNALPPAMLLIFAAVPFGASLLSEAYVLNL